MNEHVKQNPFMYCGKWFWRDNNDVARGPYNDQMDALRDLLRHVDKRSRWVVMKELWREFVAA